MAQVTPVILNEAMKAYVRTFPSEKSLKAHIFDHNLMDLQQAIETELHAVFQTVDNHLASYPGGVSWTPRFYKEYSELLLKTYPWMNEESLGHVLGYSRWICWHDGLNAPGVP
jgi:hypothetical protein